MSNRNAECKNLWYGVIAQALSDVTLCYYPKRGSLHDMLQDDAYLFLFGSGRWEKSLQFVCDMAGVEPCMVRALASKLITNGEYVKYEAVYGDGARRGYTTNS